MLWESSLDYRNSCGIRDMWVVGKDVGWPREEMAEARTLERSMSAVKVHRLRGSRKKSDCKGGVKKWKDTIKSGDGCSNGSTHSPQKDSDSLPMSLKEQEGKRQKQVLAPHLSHPATDAEKTRQNHTVFFLGCLRNKMTLSPLPRNKCKLSRSRPFFWVSLQRPWGRECCIQYGQLSEQPWE